MAATCTEPGLTAGVKCAVCGEILTAQAETAALGHEWGDWQKDRQEGATEYERRYCARNSAHFEEQSYEITTSDPAAGATSDPEAAAERPPHKFQAGQNGENLGKATVYQLDTIYDINKLNKLGNSKLQKVLKNAGVEVIKTAGGESKSITKLKKALKRLATLTTNKQTTEKIKSVLAD